MLKKAVAFTVLFCLSLPLLGQIFSDDLFGTWEVLILLEENPEIIYSPEDSIDSYSEYFLLDLNVDNTALLRREKEEPIEIEWDLHGNLLELIWPSDGDFQYTAWYHLAMPDFETIVFIIYDILPYPRVGIMRRVSVAA